MKYCSPYSVRIMRPGRVALAPYWAMLLSAKSLDLVKSWKRAVVLGTR